MKNKKIYSILFTSGGFDILHAGHIANLEEIKSRCKKLIVAVSTDELLTTYKFAKPIIPLKQRIKMIEALRCVDTVLVQDDFMNVEQFKQTKADRFALWSGWKNNKKIPTWYIENNKMLWIPYNYGISSTKIKQKIIKHAYGIMKAQLNREFNQENQSKGK